MNTSVIEMPIEISRSLLFGYLNFYRVVDNLCLSYYPCNCK